MPHPRGERAHNAFGGMREYRFPQKKRCYVEVWKSNDNKTEVHLFDPDAQNDYVFGYNPQLVSKELVERLLDEIGYTKR